MPVIVPDHEKCLFARLEKSGAAVISEASALHQDVYPARIGILNLMPAAAMEATETHWLRAISRTVLQIEPVLIKFDNDPREYERSSRNNILSRYIPFSQAIKKDLHGLIVTGDNLELRKDNATLPELLPFEEISYFKHLGEIANWAKSNIHTTIYSCLSAHFALKHFYGLQREISPDKIFGVYDHDLTGVKSDFTHKMDDKIAAPHSHWGNIPPRALKSTGVQMLAVNKQIGWLLAQDKNKTGGQDLFIQGHPEYDRLDLANEYKRDQKTGHSKPVNYFSGNNPNKKPILSWANDANTLLSNWIFSLYDYFSKQQ